MDMGSTPGIVYWMDICSHLIVMFVSKYQNKMKKRPVMAHLIKYKKRKNLKQKMEKFTYLGCVCAKVETKTFVIEFSSSSSSCLMTRRDEEGLLSWLFHFFASTSKLPFPLICLLILRCLYF